MDIQDIVEYYLRTNEYGTLCADDLLLTDSANKDLNLKRVNGPPTTSAPASAASPAPAPAASPPAASPGGRVASVDTPVPGGSVATPSSLTAAVEEDEYSSDKDIFCWMGDDDGLDFGAPLGSSTKSNPSVSLYLSSCHVSVVQTASHLPSIPLPSSSSCLVLPDCLLSVVLQLAASSIFPNSTTGVAVANTGATDHRFLDQSAFISYKRISNLQVCMGKNFFSSRVGLGHGHHFPKRSPCTRLACPSCPRFGCATVQPSGPS